MYNNIGDNEECCLNCEYWKINSQLYGPADGVICSLGNGHTTPDYCCCEFREQSRHMDYLFAPGASSLEKDNKLKYYLKWLE